MDVTGSDAAVRARPAPGAHKTYDAFISSTLTPPTTRSPRLCSRPWSDWRSRGITVGRWRYSGTKAACRSARASWPSIQAALDSSRWFVLLASPASARSIWVGEEVKYWISTKGPDHLLVVVTDGTLTWDNSRGDISLDSTAANSALLGVFSAEPKYLDMTWVRGDKSLTLHNAKFRDHVATLAAAIREVPKDDIEGEDIRQQQRVRRIVRAVIATLTVLVVLASASAVVAVFQRSQAIAQRDKAVSRQQIAQSEALGDSDPVLSRLESIAAWRIDPSSNARYAMLTAAALPGTAVLRGHTGPVEAVAFSPNGKILASGSYDNTVRLWDVATHRQIGKPLNGGDSQGILAVAFSPNGKILADGSWDRTVRLWDVATHRQIGAPLTGDTNAIEAVAFSPNGATLATGSIDGDVRLWDVATRHEIGKPLIGLSGLSGGVDTVAFSPDGSTLAAGSFDGVVRLWSVATQRQIGKSLTTPVAGDRVGGVQPGRHDLGQRRLRQRCEAMGGRHASADREPHRRRRRGRVQPPRWRPGDRRHQ